VKTFSISDASIKVEHGGKRDYGSRKLCGMEEIAELCAAASIYKMSCRAKLRLIPSCVTMVSVFPNDTNRFIELVSPINSSSLFSYKELGIT
jgi:hypothetical protein